MIRLTERRRMLIAARTRDEAVVKDHLMPVFATGYKRLRRSIGNSAVPLRKRIMKMEVEHEPGMDAFPSVITLRKVQRVFNTAPKDADRERWNDFKAALVAALLASLFLGVDDLGGIENEILLSRGYGALTFTGQLIVDDYQRRVNYNLGELADATQIGVEQAIADWAVTTAPFADLERILQGYFSEQRAILISRTEMGNVLSQIVHQTMMSHNWKEWYWDAMGEHPCTKPLTVAGRVYGGCLELNGKIFPIGHPMPPDASHPGCECLPTPKGL